MGSRYSGLVLSYIYICTHTLITECVKNPDTGERMYTEELNSANWWHRNAETLPELCKILALILYADATHLTSSGSQVAHPILLSLGNLCSRVRNKDRGMVMIGMLPILRASRAVRETEGFSEFKLSLHHQCWDILLKEVREAAVLGGIYIRVMGETLYVFPMIPFIQQDNQEGAAMCGVKLGHEVLLPCRMCWITKADCNNPRVVAERRTEVQMKKHVKKYQRRYDLFCM